MIRRLALSLCVLVSACSGGAPAPVTLQSGTPCTHCRMTLIDARLSSQLLVAGDEPRFFDDLGCLAAYLRAHPAGTDAVVYVADHADGAWVEASQAIYGRDDALATPMSSHLFAHASAASRARDTSVRADRVLHYADVLAAASAGEGSRDR